MDDDPDDLALLEDEIGYRYAHDYVVVARSVTHRGSPSWRRLRTGDRLAAVLASQWMDEMEGSHLLASGRALHPRAKGAAHRAEGLGEARDRRRHPLRHRVVVSTPTC